MENYKDLFISYLNNELDGDELKNLLQWMKDPANSKTMEDWMGEDWASFSNAHENMPNREFTSLRKGRKPEYEFNPDDRKIKITKVLYRLAASFLLPVAIGTLTWFIFSKTEKADQIVFNEINVPIGSKTKVTLADGTNIWLNAGSKLRYPQKFSGKTREVELNGEGFFNVTKNPDKPFIVKTADIKIKVLGTSFNVKSYSDERTVETTLVTGSVTIEQNKAKAGKSDKLTLKPNQRATFIKDKGKIILSGCEKEAITQINSTNNKSNKVQQVLLLKDIDTEQYTAWKDNKLIFKNEDLESLCTRLERWFDVKINIKNNELKKFHYTGTIEKETINDIIDILKLTMHFKYKINHSVIEIWKE